MPFSEAGSGYVDGEGGMETRASALRERWLCFGGLTTFLRIGQCESSFYRLAYNPNGPYVGIFQHALSSWTSRSENRFTGSVDAATAMAEQQDDDHHLRSDDGGRRSVALDVCMKRRADSKEPLMSTGEF